MAHLRAAMSAMARHCHVAAVVEQGLVLLANEAGAADNRETLMIYLRVVLSAMARHVDALPICRSGLGFMLLLSELPDNVAMMRASGVRDVVRQVRVAHPHVRQVNTLCERLLTKLLVSGVVFGLAER